MDTGFPAQLVASVLAQKPSPESRVTAALVQLKTARQALDAGDYPTARLFLADALLLLDEVRRRV